jgi:hypothetical protein
MSSSSSSITAGNLSFDPKDAAEDQLGELGIERLRTLYVEIGGMQDPAKDFGAHHRTAHWKIIRACMVIWEHLNIVVYDALDKCHYFVHVPEEGGTEAGEDVPPVSAERVAQVGREHEAGAGASAADSTVRFQELREQLRAQQAELDAWFGDSSAGEASERRRTAAAPGHVLSTGMNPLSPSTPAGAKVGSALPDFPTSMMDVDRAARVSSTPLPPRPTQPSIIVTETTFASIANAATASALRTSFLLACTMMGCPGLLASPPAEVLRRFIDVVAVDAWQVGAEQSRAVCEAARAALNGGDPVPAVVKLDPRYPEVVARYNQDSQALLAAAAMHVPANPELHDALQASAKAAITAAANQGRGTMAPVFSNFLAQLEEMTPVHSSLAHARGLAKVVEAERLDLSRLERQDKSALVAYNALLRSADMANTALVELDLTPSVNKTELVVNWLTGSISMGPEGSLTARLHHQLKALESDNACTSFKAPGGPWSSALSPELHTRALAICNFADAGRSLSGQPKALSPPVDAQLTEEALKALI